MTHKANRKLHNETKGTIVCRTPKCPGLWRPEHSECAARGLRVSIVPIGLTETNHSSFKFSLAGDNYNMTYSCPERRYIINKSDFFFTSN